MESPSATKLDLDFEAPSWRGARMDGDTDDLMLQLCTRIGMIMEDASALALTIGSLDSAARLVAIGELETAAAKIASLIAIVRALSS